MEQIHYFFEQFLRPKVTLLKECVRQHALPDGCTRESARHGNHRDGGEPAPHNGKELESAHIGHLKIRDDDVWE
jgi:hypothetical protein